MLSYFLFLTFFFYYSTSSPYITSFSSIVISLAPHLHQVTRNISDFLYLLFRGKITFLPPLLFQVPPLSCHSLLPYYHRLTINATSLPNIFSFSSATPLLHPPLNPPLPLLCTIYSVHLPLSVRCLTLLPLYFSVHFILLFLIAYATFGSLPYSLLTLLLLQFI